MITCYKSWFFKKVDKHLESKDLKKTSQRSAIMNKLLGMGGHVYAETLFSELKKDGLTIGLATIYRTLRLLKESGVLEEHYFTEGRSVFELHLPDKYHHHLICLSCGKVVEFLDPSVESLQEKIALEKGFSLQKHTMNLYGHCSNCQEDS